MAGTNPTDPFAELYTQGSGRGSTNTLDEIAARKQQELEQRRQRNLQRLEQASAEKNPDAWVNGLGLDPDSLAGRATNVAASVVSAGSRTVGNVLSVPDALLQVNHSMAADPEIRAAQNRYDAGQATQEDIELLNQPYIPNREAQIADGYEPQSEEAKARRANRQTNLEVGQNVTESRERLQGIQETTDIDEIVHQGARREFSEDIRDVGDSMSALSDSWDGITDGEFKDNAATFVKSLSDIVLNGGEAILTNPQAMTELMAEQVPDLLLGAASKPAMVMANMNEGLRSYQKGLEKYAAENNGAAPPEDLNRRMLYAALGSGVLDTVGEFKMLDATGKVRDAIKQGRSAMKAGGKAVVQSGFVEGATEGTQTKLQGEASLEPASGMDVYEGVVTGTGVGGGITTGSSLGEGVSTSREQKQEQEAEEEQEAVAQAQTIEDYVLAGRFDDAIDDPEMPQDQVALAIAEVASKKDGSDEQVAQARRALSRVQSEVDEQIKVLEQDTGMMSEESQEKLKAEIRRFSSLAKQAEEAGNTEAVETAKKLIQARKDILRSIRETPAEQKKEFKERLATLKRAKEMAGTNAQRMADQQAEAMGARDLVSRATDKTQDTTVRKQAADDSVSLFMSNTSKLTQDDVDSLIDQADDVLDEGQRTYLRSLSEAMQARNRASSLDTVHTDIFAGSPDKQFRGLSEYRENVMRALDAGNQEQAQRELEQLAQFERSHQRKAQAAQEAHEAAKRRGQPHNVWRDLEDDTGWTVAPGRGRQDDGELRKNGGLQIGRSGKYANVVNTLRGEADAITATRKELEAAARLGQPTQTEQANAETEAPARAGQPEAASTAPVSSTNSSDDSTNPETGSEVGAQADQEAVEERAQETEQTGTDETDTTATEQENVNEETAPEPETAATETSEEGVEAQPTEVKGFADLPSKDPQERTMTYAGIGSRKTPPEVQKLMTAYAKRLESLGYTLRSGGAKGADSAFEKGTNIKEVFYASDATDVTRGIAKEIHPKPDALKGYALDLMARNTNQLFGEELDTPADFVIAWTPDGAESAAERTRDTGGTGQAIEMASRKGIPVFNLAKEDGRQRFEAFMQDQSNSAEDSAPSNEKDSGSVYPHIEFTGPTDKSFRKKNLVGEYFTLRKTKEEQDSLHPLTQQRDFVSSVLAPAVTGRAPNAEALGDYVADLKPVDPATGTNNQIGLLKTFVQYQDDWSGRLDKLFKAGAAEYRYKNPVQFLADDNGQLPENVKTAISAGVFTELQAMLSDDALNTPDDVKAILGLSDTDPLYRDTYDYFADKGTMASNVQQSVGASIYQALGLKASLDAPVNHQAQLEAALGAYGLALMVDAGLVERVRVKHKALRTKEAQVFVRPVREDWNDTYALPENSQRLVDASKNTDGVLNKLFGVDQLRPDPSFEPIELTQKTAKRTQEPLSKKQAKIVADEQQDGWTMREDILASVEALQAVAPDQYKELLYRMAGVVDLKTRRTQRTLEKSIQGKNDGLTREVDTILEFADHPEFTTEEGQRNYTKPFYLPLSVWSVQRVGINSRVNPLESKVHRFFVGKPAWKHRVPVKGNGKGVSNEDKHALRQFRLAVLEGLGKPVDKQSNDTSLKDYNKAVAEVQPHVDTVAKLITGQVVDQAALTAMADYVAGEEGFHTYDTLVHLARKDLALASGQTFFESSLIREGDGITNGPAFATILSGAWKSLEHGKALVNKMGLFEKGNPVQSAGEWQENPNNHDLYETLAARVDDLVDQTKPVLSKEARNVYGGIFQLLGGRFRVVNEDGSKGKVTGKGRKRVKTPLTSMAFGAGVPKAVRGMGDELVEIFYQDIDAILNNNKLTDEEKVREINEKVRYLNPLLGSRPLGRMTLDKAQKLELTNEQHQSVVDSFVNTLGAHIETALQEQFDSPLMPNGEPDPSVHSFIQHRNIMNQVADRTFKLYELARDFEIDRYVEELRNNGDLPTDVSGKHALQWLSKRQLRELDQRLKDLNPVVHTAMSKASGQREAGINMAKQRLVPMKDNRAFATEVSLGKKLPVTKLNGEKDSTKTLQAYGQAMGLEAPGVRTFITTIHAFDSAVASDTYKDFPALNVHDAEVVSANIMQTVAEQMNGATARNLIEFSLAEEVMQTAFRTIDAFEAKLPEMQAYEKYAGAQKALEAAKTQAKTGLKSAQTAETNKLNLLAEIETVNQYGVEGGEYHLEADDYKAIAEKQQTSIAERLAQRRARGQDQNADAIAAQMREMMEDLEQIDGGMDSDQYNQLEAVQINFLAHGDLDKAITDVMGEKAAPDARREILNRMAKHTAKTADVRTMAPSHVARLISLASTNNGTPEQLRKDLTLVSQKVLREMKDERHLKPLSVLVRKALGDEARTEAVINYLNRLQNSTGITPWGVMGQPTQPNDPKLVGLLERTPDMPVKNLLAQLTQTPITKALRKLVSPDLRVRYITGRTPANFLPAKDLTGAKGYWDVRNGVESLGIKSPEFVDASVTEELITHEALHSVLYHTVDAVQSGKNTDADAVAFVKELEQLRANTVKWLNRPENTGLRQKFLEESNALENVHELIAWGMTNQEFQREVLAQVRMETKNSNRLTTALKNFVNAIAKFLFGKNAGKVRTNGVGVLLVNTAGLMEQSKKDQHRASNAHQQQNTGPQPEDIKNWSYQDLFNMLDAGDLKPTDVSRLQSVMDSVVVRVQGESGPWAENVDAASPTERAVVSEITGRTPFSSEVLGVFPLTDRQIFVLEQAELSLQESMASDTLAYKELVRVFREARETLSPKDFYDGDWRQAHNHEKKEAQEKYDLLFKLKTSPGSDRTNHLSRFAALSLVVPEIHDKLQAPMMDEQHTGTGLGDRIKGFYDGALSRLGHQINRTYEAQPTNDRVQSLAYRLADIQAKHKQTLARKRVPLAEEIENIAVKGNRQAMDLLGKASKPLQGAKNSYIRALGETGSTIAEDRVGEVVEALMEFRHEIRKQRQGLASSLITEIRGATDKNAEFYRLLRQASKNERERELIKNNLKEDIAGKGESTGRFASKLTKETSDALTKALLRTDLTALSGQYPDSELVTLLDSPQALQKEITKWEKQLAGVGQHVPYYFVQAKALGYQMATGRATAPGMHKNAYTLARAVGTNKKVSEAKAQQAEAILDPLISLYALKYTPHKIKQTAARVMHEENRRGKESGVRYVLALHERLKAEALETLFDGEPGLFMKGYTREIYNPYTEVKPADPLEGEELKKSGWEPLPKYLVRDSADPDQTTNQQLYVRKWGGLQHYVSGSVSLTGTRNKGTAINGGEFDESTDSLHEKNQQENQRITAQHNRKLQELESLGRSFDPDTVSDNYLVPIRNAYGEPKGYRYFMTESNKDTILERNNRVEDVMAAMGSHMFDKATTEQQNRDVMESLKAFEEAEYNKNPNAFIEVSPDSKDKRARETWHLLPPKTKQTIRELYGTAPVRVHVEMMDMVFGYRKYSAQGMFDKAAVQRNAVEHFMVWLLGSIFRDNASFRVRQIGNVWGSLVQMVKDNWVIKNWGTISTNILSNLSILAWNGLSPRRTIETHKEAIEGLMTYTRHHDELLKLEREQSLGLSVSPARTDQRIAELRDAIDRNPVKGLLDEGLFQTIIEDVDNEEDNYSYKSHLMKEAARFTDKLPDSVVTGAKWVYMTHDTPLYKVLFKTTQMSDFVARYSLYQHVTTRKTDPLDHKSAVQLVEDTFVNYSVPTHRTLQYLNDIGATFFTKYYLRIQKVILRLFRDNPVKGAIVGALELFFDNFASVLDSAPSIGNPFDVGALNWPGSVSDIIPISLMRSVF